MEGGGERGKMHAGVLHVHLVLSPSPPPGALLSVGAFLYNVGAYHLILFVDHQLQWFSLPPPSLKFVFYPNKNWLYLISVLLNFMLNSRNPQHG